VVEQATHSDGNRGADVLADENSVYWTRTAWHEAGSMQDFAGSEPHLSTMARIDDWCDEATFVNWEQSGTDLPEWQTGFDRLISDGQVSSLTRGTAAHKTRAFPPPTESK
jgi:hypothetical protein